MAESRCASMVGRGAQLAVLRERAAAAGARRPSVVAVLGEAGIGKTRLVDELAQELVGERVLVARGHCAPGAARGLSLGPVRELVSALGRELGPGLGRLASSDDRTMAALLGEPVGGQAGDTTVRSQAQLFDVVARVLRDVARPRRLLLVVEDVHWADDTSRDFLEFLGRSLHDEQLLLVLTARTGDPAYESCRALVADLAGLRHGTRLELARLTEEQVRRQVADLRADRVPEAPELARIVALTEGVPLLVEEVVDTDLDDVGALADVLVGHRIARLSPAARTVVETAAVAVLEPTPAQLAEAVPLPSEACDEAFADAVAGGVLVRHHGKVRFRHALLREATLSRLLPHTERTLHQAWSALIGDLPQGRAATVAAAHHRRGAGDLDGALEACLEAATLAHRISAYAEELQMFTQAAELWPSVPDAGTRTGTTLSDVYEQATWASYQITDREESRRLVDAALEALPADASRHRRAMLRLLWRRMRWHDNPGVTTADVLATVTEVEMDPPSADAALACLTAAEALLQSGEATSAERYARLAVDKAEAVGDDETLGFSLSSLGDALARQGKHHDALPEAERAVGLAAREGDLFARVYALTGLLFDRWLAGESTLELAERLVELLGGERPGPLRGRWVGAQGDVAESLMDVGRWDEAQVVLERAVREPVPGVGCPTVRRLLDHLAIWRGHEPPAGSWDPSVTPAHATVDDSGLDALLLARYTDCDIAARSGNLLAARAHASAAVLDDRVVHNCGYLLPLLLVAARVEADLAVASGGDPTPADGQWVCDRIQHLIALAPPHNPRDEAYVAHARAELDRRGGADTAATWAAVVASWRAVSRPFQLGAALVRYGEACRIAGHTAEAGSALREALQIGEQLGARPLVEEVLAVSRRAHLRLAADTGHPTSRFGLTRRELDVLRLVDEGASNASIAKTLVISPKTASVHVSNILGKLHVSTRGEAAAVARRAGLLEVGTAVAPADLPG